MGIVPSVSLSGRFRKTLLVCSGNCQEVETRLAGAGWVVTKVRDGTTAVSKIRREIFDTAVLVSTGQEMDLAETIFNLRDIKNSLEIVIVTDCAEASKDVVAEIVTTVPNTIAVDLPGLEALLKLSGTGVRENTEAVNR